ncbi:DM13 domain-containing protein [Kitasatospora sp. NBC_00240]|uniref:DM13 domain-containing protein n=1 Tax=Kitasatospora sp. NBC_00240 TaxID=2903567 RepID=UPI0022516EAB|nr:DM13 domain-containing protein [Kitasatospora sp. NBC_00240]MCX5208032.1 DM13 domain-containing protein [Kitasatospora sp. NBC_00240]
MSARPPLSVRRPRRWPLPVAVLVLLAGGFGLYLFQPWKAFTSTRVDEAPPAGAAPLATPAAGTPAGGASPSSYSSPSPSPSSSPSPSGPGPAESASSAGGSFQSGEHPTTGTARLVRLADGSTVLRLENLRTSEGPDVRVYLSAAPAAESKLDSLGDAPVELGRLKGNLGNQNYAVPAGTDLTRLHSAVIWCARFSVGFGAADLPASDR